MQKCSILRGPTPMALLPLVNICYGLIMAASLQLLLKPNLHFEILRHRTRDHVCILSTWDAEAGDLKFWASLEDAVRPCLKNQIRAAAAVPW